MVFSGYCFSHRWNVIVGTVGHSMFFPLKKKNSNVVEDSWILNFLGYV